MKQGRNGAGRGAIGLTVAFGLALSSAGLFAVRAAGPDKIMIWSPGDNGTVKDWTKDAILAEVERATNTDIEIVRIGWDVYTDRLNAAIASGKVPDIITTVDHNNKTLIGQMIKDGIVAPFDGDLGKLMPNVLAEYQKNASLNELKYDGKIYMKPVSWGAGNYPNQGILHVRKDVLDKLRLKAPETFAQYADYLRACTKTGLKGVVFAAGGDGGLGGLTSAFAGAYGLPFGGWVKAKDRGFGAAAIQPGMADALLLFRAMVADGLVDPQSWEFKNGDDARNKYVAGETCALIFNGGGHIGRIQNDMDAAKKGAENWVLPALSAGKGARGYTTEPRFWSGTFLAKLPGNNPTAGARVLNYLSSQQGLDLTSLGIRGQDYEKKGSEIVLNKESRSAHNFPSGAGDTGAHPLATPIVSWVPQELQDFSLLYGKPKTYQTWYRQMFANQGKYKTPSYGLLTTTPLWTKASASLNDLTARSLLEIVRSGSEADARAKFEAFVKAWLAQGAEAQSEMSTALAAIYK